MRLLIAPALLVAVACAGCGSSGSSSSTANTTSTSAEAAKAMREVAAARRRAEAKAPKGASPTLRAIYATFPSPKPNPALKGSARAIKAGEKACRGKTPTQVKEEFYAAARAKLSSEQAKMIARIGDFEAHAQTDASFVAGQLAGDVYQATLPAGVGQYGYQGCVYALSQRLKRELAPGAGR